MGLRLLGKGCHRLSSTVLKDGSPSFENHAWFKSNHDNDRMLNGVDFDLGALQGLTDSPREVLRQTMLYHENIFRSQVVELHRLYLAQKNLMNDRHCRDFDGNAVSMSTPNSIPNQAERDFLIPHSLTMSSNQTHSSNIFKECCGNSPKLHNVPDRNFNLHLPFDAYIKDVATECMEMHNPLGNKALDGCDLEEFEFTLGSKNENSEKKIATITLLGEKSCLSTKDAIDLVESEEFSCNKNVRTISSFSFRSHIAESASLTDTQLPSPSDVTSPERLRCTEFMSDGKVGVVSKFSFDTRIAHNASVSGACLPTSSDVISSGGAQEEITHKNSACHPDADLSERLQESSFVHPDQGLNDSSGSSSIILIKEKCSCSRKPFSFDLNMPQVEEFPEMSWSEENCHQDEDNPVVPRSDSQVLAEACGDSKGGISCCFDGDGPTNTSGSASLSPGICHLHDEDADTSLALPGSHMWSDRCILSTASRNKKEDYSSCQALEISNLLQNVQPESDLKRATYERSEEDTVSSSPCGNLMSVEGTISASHSDPEHGHYGDDPVGGKHDHIDRNRTCNRSVLSTSYDTQNSQISSVVMQKHSGEPKLMTEADGRVGLTGKTCSYGELQCAEHLHKRENPTAEPDCPVWRAAESLIHISLSLQNAANPSDEIANISQIKLENTEVRDQPQYSSDSFEAIALALTESVNDEYSMPCRPTEEETGKSACKYKLRRGRGLHDFQKEILPGLVSLSRHEICEDLHTIAEAVRSQELSEGSRSLCRGNWFTPVRSRRSRLNYVVRRWQ
uniref:Modification methylase XhoI n=1 Tax=Anthurium amnicola TaxID=1678845 RepID=A0A1D1ZI77_9ARAE